VSEHDALLAAARSDPEDDTVRLALADLLEENGDAAQATFVRAQVALARLPMGDPRQGELHHRAAALLKTHRVRWLGDRATASPAEAWVFSRGIPYRLNLEDEGLGDASLARLIATGCLAGVASLNLEGNELTDRGARALAHAPDVRGVEELSLYGNRIGDTGLLELMHTSHLPRLARLDLRYNLITDAGLRDLPLAPNAGKLAAVDLWGNPVTGDAIETLRRALPGCAVAC
jgi:uncharacterized protein (TIGR02996 family)